MGPSTGPLFLMDRCAVFVDAGYLLSEGAKAYCAVRKRSLVTCDFREVAQAIETYCCELHGMPALRTYWYDGARDAVPTEDHLLVASLPRVKLRLGRLSGGKQKGVDSLIVHDLITLAHERAVTSMYLLGGDEDLREGVSAAQRLGVQVCLLGIETGKTNQALPLIREADEHIVLPADLLRAHFGLAGSAPVEEEPAETVKPDLPATTDEEEPVAPEAAVDIDKDGETAAQVGREFAAAWASHAELAELAELMLLKPRIPRELDVQLLLRAEEVIGKSLRGAPEAVRRALRAAFWKELDAVAIRLLK
jgi:uncharacterized LabA/DUF88 family protein